MVDHFLRGAATVEHTPIGAIVLFILVVAGIIVAPALLLSRFKTGTSAPPTSTVGSSAPPNSTVVAKAAQVDTTTVTGALPKKAEPAKREVYPPNQPSPAKAPQATSAATAYVIQVGSKLTQTEALITFTDMQRAYPSLLAAYRPMVRKADLGAKGIWYRLRIGPINDKTAATKLCSQLPSQGLPDCLVMAASRP